MSLVVLNGMYWQSLAIVRFDCFPHLVDLYILKCLFLDSLISYFVMKKDLILLECLQSGAVNTKCFKEEEHQYNYEEKNNVCSKYPMLDKYIHSMIYPGKIRLCKYFEDIKLLVYEILGYRYI